MSPIQARAAAQHDAGLMRIYQFVTARAARYGIILNDEKLDLKKIDSALANAKASLDDRMLFKSKLRELRLI